MAQYLTDNGFSVCEQMEGFSAHMGPFYQKIIEGTMHRALCIEQKHLNPEGVVHGGVSLAFADYVIYRAIGDEIGHQIKFATINLNCNLISAAKQGEVLFGTGCVVRKTKSVIFAEGHLFTDDKVILRASGVWKIIGGG